MPEPLDETYFHWLYGQVAAVRIKNPARSYWALLRALHSTEFVWLIANDDNRLEDGRDLRSEFILDEGIDSVEKDWMTIGCSMLEMLIGLSRRLAFESDNDDPARWFWHLLNNINLGNFNDSHIQSEQQLDYINQVLEQVIWRNYRQDGRGGLFPLRRPQEDQRQVELWYQLSSYLIEGHSV